MSNGLKQTFQSIDKMVVNGYNVRVSNNAATLCSRLSIRLPGMGCI